MNAEQLDHTVMPRGKFSHARGNPKTPSQIAEIEPQYLVWAWSAWTDRKPCSHLLLKECERDVADNQRQQRVARDQDD